VKPRCGHCSKLQRICREKLTLPSINKE
jgi:hypothetical protein